jgi:hypothetical protein
MAPAVIGSNFPHISVQTHKVPESQEADSVEMGHGDPFPGNIFIMASFQHKRLTVGSYGLVESGLAISEILQPGGQVF